MDDVYRSRLGIVFEWVRNSKGLTQVQLGDELGIDNSTVSYLESGDRYPSFQTLDGYGSYFKFPGSFMLLLADDPSSMDGFTGMLQQRVIEGCPVFLGIEAVLSPVGL